MKPLLSLKFTDSFRFAEKGILLLLWAATASLAVVFIFEGLLKLTYPLGFNYVESMIAAPVLQLPQNPFVYGDLETPPFLATVYPPLYLYLSFLVSSLGMGVLTAGRFVSGAALLATVMGTGLFLRKKGTSPLAAAICALLYLVSPLLHRYGFTMRVEMLGVLLSLAGFVFMTNEDSNHRPKKWVWGIACIALAVLTKQSFVAVVCAVVLWQLSQKRFLDAGRYLLIQCAAIALPFVIISFLTRGNFIEHQWLLTTHVYYPELISRFWLGYLKEAWPLLIMGILYAVIWFRQPDVRAWGFYLFSSAALLTIALGKNGADDNYFIELNALLCVTAGLCFKEVFAVQASRRLLKAGWVILIGIQVGLFWQAGEPLAFGHRLAQHQHSRSHAAALTERIRKLPGNVLSEDLSLLIASQKAVLFEPFGMTQAANAGRWDEELILKMLREKRFSLLIFSFNIDGVRQTSRFSQSFLEEVRRSYYYLGTRHGQHFYFPNKHDL